MTSALTEVVGSRIVDGSVRVPMLPHVAWKLLTFPDDADVRSFETLVYGDHALAAHVMRIANSPALAGRVPVLSLRQALVRLGMRLLREVALVAAVSDNVVRLPGYEVQLRGLWRQALRTALWAKVVSDAHGASDPEHAFIAGLLVDVGRAVAFRVTVETARDLGHAVSPEIALGLAETHQRGIGLRIVDAWQLPDQLRAVIEFAGRPHAAGPHKDLVLVVGLGRWLAATEDDERHLLGNHAAVKALAIEPERVRRIIKQARRVDELLESFSL